VAARYTFVPGRREKRGVGISDEEEREREMREVREEMMEKRERGGGSFLVQDSCFCVHACKCVVLGQVLAGTHARSWRRTVDMSARA
jgi:hypothetical protein